jgi:hypothetical protein
MLSVHSCDEDQDDGPNETGNEIAEPTKAEWNTEQAEQPTSDSGSHNAEHDVHQKPISLFMNCSASHPAIPPMMLLAQ